VSAALLAIVAARLGGERQAAAFMGAGFLLLVAGIMAVYYWMALPHGNVAARKLSLRRLAIENGRRNRLRSTLTVGLVGIASFLILAVSAFRLAPSREGTGGFDWIADSDQPIFANLNDREALQAVVGGDLDRADEGASRQSSAIFSFRFKPGEDASCTNLYQSTQPQTLGATIDFIKSFDAPEGGRFRWAATEATSDEQLKNAWRLLLSTTDDGSIPVVIDKNTANYSLKIFSTGGNYEVQYDTGERVRFRVVGFLENSILQGSLIISEENFVRTFPGISGYRRFLIRDFGGTDASGSPPPNSIAGVLENRFREQGFDARSTMSVLARFQTVQNAYISTFQALGALGLLMGTFGLAAVQIRAVAERRKELGLLRCVGFDLAQLSRMVLVENASLLLMGVAVGVGSALFATLPHLLLGGASIPWIELAATLAVIVLVGLLASMIGARMTSRMPLVESLRAEF
jgi:hypothetical protein